MEALKQENLSLKSSIHDLEEKLDASENNMKRLEGKVTSSEAEALNVYEQIKKEKERLDKQAGAELGQAQLKLGLDLTSTSSH